MGEAETLAERVATLPEVAQAVTAASFIPGDQDQKLAIIADLALLLGPTLSPEVTLPPTSDEILASMAACAMRCSRSRPAKQRPSVRRARRCGWRRRSTRRRRAARQSFRRCSG